MLAPTPLPPEVESPVGIDAAAAIDHSATALRRTGRVAIILLVLLLAGAGLRTWSNQAQARQVAEEALQSSVRTVLTTLPTAGKAERSVALPATLHGRNEAVIYARTNGYVRAWKKDLGDTVRQGDVLVLIDTPEVDQDLAHARAVLSQVQAKLSLAQSSLARFEGLRSSHAVSQQEYDERRAALQQAEADLAAAQANVKRLQQLHDFGRVTAPFDGVVVKRLVDVGALVASGSATTTRPLYELAETRDLRLTVGVPQAFAADAKVGKPVQVRLLEHPVQPFKGTISRVSGGLDAATRALEVEVVLPNEDGQLRPGAYVEVQLALSTAGKALLLPPNALQFRQDGPRVAVVDAQQHIAIKPIKLGRDLGKQVEVLAGLSPQDRVVLNPPDALEPGEAVKASAAPPPSRNPTPPAANRSPS